MYGLAGDMICNGAPPLKVRRGEQYRMYILTFALNVKYMMRKICKGGEQKDKVESWERGKKERSKESEKKER